jgi:hypothetical protein
MRIVFASLKEPDKYGYAYDSEAGWNSNFCLCRNYQQFETYGHGLIQHSGEWTVQVDFLADYLASAAKFCLEAPTENSENLLQHLRYEIMRRPVEKVIAFAASVVFKPKDENTYYEKKTRWFSVEECKISTSDSKRYDKRYQQVRYDKRYQQVEKCHDGSPDAIYRMLITEHADGLQFYTYADAIRDWCQDGEGNERPYFYGLTAQFLKWFDSKTEPARDLRYAYNAIRSLCEAYQHHSEAETALQNLHWPIEAKTEDAA